MCFLGDEYILTCLFFFFFLLNVAKTSCKCVFVSSPLMPFTCHIREVFSPRNGCSVATLDNAPGLCGNLL